VKVPDKVFFTGVPGSRWSAIAQAVESGGNFNKSDRLPHRQWRVSWIRVGHQGNYFGTGMEFESDLDQDLLAPWYDVGGTKLIKSHEWVYKLDEIIEKYPDDWIMLVYRQDYESWTAWLESGGFHIPYPNYDHYENRNEMLKHIQAQNKAMLKFSKKHKLAWEHFSADWVYENFGHDINPFWTKEINADIFVTVYKPEEHRTTEKETTDATTRKKK